MCLYERSRDTLTICHGEALLDESGTACWWGHAYIRLRRYMNHPCTQCLHNTELKRHYCICISQPPSHFFTWQLYQLVISTWFSVSKGDNMNQKDWLVFIFFVCLQIYFWFICHLYSEGLFGWMCLPAYCTSSTLSTFFCLDLFFWASLVSRGCFYLSSHHCDHGIVIKSK